MSHDDPEDDTSVDEEEWAEREHENPDDVEEGGDPEEDTALGEEEDDPAEDTSADEDDPADDTGVDEEEWAERENETPDDRE